MQHIARKVFVPWLVGLSLCAAGCAHAKDGIVYQGGSGPGKGRHIVFIGGDEEYRSEEGLPQLARILAQRHGFKCTVSLSVNPQSGELDPNTKNNNPGIEALDSADLCVILLRFREWPDEQMKHFVDYLNAGKPIIALRTSTHAFAYGKNSTSPYAKFGWQGKEWPGGFGRQVLGESWVSHWGKHKFEATLGVVEAGAKDSPLFRGVGEIFGDTDVYEAWPPPDAKILVRGRVLKGMTPTDPPADYKKKNAKGVEQGVNDPMMPVLWTREVKNEAGKMNKILCTTLGSATDLQNEGLRRLLVNTAYEFTGLEKKIPAKANVDLVGEFKPSFYGFNGYKKGVKPADLEVK
jgi:hypothetical protein